MSLIWDSLQVYAFPPFAVINQVLTKLQMLSGMEMTLSNLFWRQNEWLPGLLDRLSCRASTLEECTQSHSHWFHQNLHMFQHHAWKPSSYSRVNSDSF